MPLEEAKARQKLSLDEATDQITQYFGFIGIVEIEAGGEVFEIRSKLLFTPEQQKRMEDLDEFVKTCDQEDVERRNFVTNEVVVHPKTGEPVTDKFLLIPHKIKGKPIDPSYETRYMQALWGQDIAKRAEAAGITYGLVSMWMAKMDDEFAQWKRSRQQRDPKSAGSSDGVAVVREGD